MKPYKLCILTYKKLAELVDETLSSLKDLELDIMAHSCHHASIYECVQKAQADGAEVFIAGGSNYEIFRNKFALPIIELSLSYADYFRSILEASSQYGNTVAVVTYLSEPPYDFTTLASLLGIKIVNIVYTESGQLQPLIEDCGCNAIVGASFACEIAATTGKGSVLAYSGSDEILRKINEAKALAHEIRREKSKAKFFATIIDNSPNAILGVDAEGVVINYNPAAERILGISALQARGRQSQHLFPELKMDRILMEDPQEAADQIIVYRGKELHLARFFVTDSSDGGSAIALLSESSRHIKAELNYIDQRHERITGRGFTAKNTFETIVTANDKILEIIQRAKVYAASNYSILIYGETGTGKELFVQSIHNYSSRKNQSFVAINCAAIPDNLMESELFGYVDGAFTGSRKGGKKGLFELANKGTVFLDEISDLSQVMQQKLLRTLQEQEIMRVGDDRVIPIDVRIITATNKPPDVMLSEGFRSDFYYRLNVLSLEIPPLRERGKDVIKIFSALLKKHTDNYKLPAIPESAFSILTYYSWPGNVRELENVCKRFSLLLSQHSGKTNFNAVKQLLCECIGPKNILEDIYTKYNFSPNKASGTINKSMVEAIKYCFGYANEYIADLLGVSRTTLWRLMKG